MAENYVVTDVNERRRFSPAGKDMLYFDVHIKTKRGSTGSIRMPEVEYKAEKVKELLADLADQLDMPFAL